MAEIWSCYSDSRQWKADFHVLRTQKLFQIWNYHDFSMSLEMLMRVGPDANGREGREMPTIMEFYNSFYCSVEWAHFTYHRNASFEHLLGKEFLKMTLTSGTAQPISNAQNRENSSPTLDCDFTKESLEGTHSLGFSPISDMLLHSFQAGREKNQKNQHVFLYYLSEHRKLSRVFIISLPRLVARGPNSFYWLPLPRSISCREISKQLIALIHIKAQ